MQKIDRIQQIPVVKVRDWQAYLLDTIIAFFTVLVLTGILVVAHLYPNIPNISLLYLLIIISLAILRGSYAAILAALIATFAFDFFLVPPLYTFNVARRQEWVALLVFLVTALIVSLLTASVRRSRDEAWLRESQMRALYDLMFVINDNNNLDAQLDIVALSIARVFAQWGIQSCCLLLPDHTGKLVVRADAPIQLENFVLSPNESQLASQVMASGNVFQQTTEDSASSILCFIPLKNATQTFAVLALRIQDSPVWRANTPYLQKRATVPSIESDFFWTFLDQATLLIECAILRAQKASDNI